MSGAPSPLVDFAFSLLVEMPGGKLKFRDGAEASMRPALAAKFQGADLKQHLQALTDLASFLHEKGSGEAGDQLLRWMNDCLTQECV